METESFHNPFVAKIKVLSHLLILSVGINIGFGATFAYNYIKSNFEPVYHASLPEIALKNEHADLLQNFFQMSFDELVLELTNSMPISDGYQIRDLALAILSTYHYLDIEKSLKGESLEVREVMFVHTDGGEQFPLTLYPNVKEYHYSLIRAYIDDTKYPLVAEGLFAELKQKKVNSPTDLALSFMHTKEFMAIHSFVARFFDHLAPEKVLIVLLDGSFKDIERFYYLYLENIEKPKEMMRYFFKTYCQHNSKYAASMWIAIDEDYILHQLSNEEISSLIKLTDNESLLSKVRQGVRSEQVRDLAEKAAPIEEIKAPLQVAQKMESQDVVSYEVQKGDSLWKIAHKHRVSVAEIKRINSMSSDLLRPGQSINLPKK